MALSSVQRKPCQSITDITRHHKTSQDITRHHKTSQDITAGCGNDRAQLHQLLLVDTNLSKLRDQQKLGFEIETYWKYLKAFDTNWTYLNVSQTVWPLLTPQNLAELSSWDCRVFLVCLRTASIKIYLNFHYNMQWLQCSHPNLWQCTGCSFFFLCGRAEGIWRSQCEPVCRGLLYCFTSISAVSDQNWSRCVVNSVGLFLEKNLGMVIANNLDTKHAMVKAWLIFT